MIIGAISKSKLPSEGSLIERFLLSVLLMQFVQSRDRCRKLPRETERHRQIRLSQCLECGTDFYEKPLSCCSLMYETASREAWCDKFTILEFLKRNIHGSESGVTR